MLYNFIGYYALFIVLIENAKEDMKEELKNTPDKKELTLLRLPYSDGNVKDKDFELIDEDEFAEAVVKYEYTKEFQEKMYSAANEALELANHWKARPVPPHFITNL